MKMLTRVILGMTLLPILIGMYGTLILGDNFFSVKQWKVSSFLALISPLIFLVMEVFLDE